MPTEPKPVGKLTPLIPKQEVKPVGTLKPLESDRAYYEATGQAVKSDPKISQVWGTPKETSLTSDIYHSLARGSDRLGSMLAKTPAMIYDLAAMATDATVNTVSKGINAVAGTNLKTDYETTSEDFGKQLGLGENKIAKYYDDRVKQSQEIAAKKYDKGITEYFGAGEFKKGFGLLANSVAESAPVTISLLMGNAAGVSTAASIVGGGTAFAADKKAELDANAPNMGHTQKMNIAMANGLFEGVFEQFGITKLGGLTKNVLLRDGKEAAKKVAEEGFKDVYSPVAKKYLGNAAEESISEAATQFAQNAVDKYSGYKPDLNLREGVADAAIIGLGAGVSASSVPAAIEAGSNAKANREGKKIKNELVEKDKEQSRHAFEVASQGDEAVQTFKTQVGEELKKGNLTTEQADAAITRVNSFKEYNDITNTLDLSDEKKLEIFDKTFQKQNLETELSGYGDPKKLHPLKQAEYAVKEKLANDLQKDINEIMLNAQVKNETTLGTKTIDDLAKKEAKANEKPKPGENKPKESEALKAFRDKYKEKLPKEDERTFEDIPAYEYNDSKFNTRLKHKKTAEFLDKQPSKTVFGKVAERHFSYDGKTNSVLGIELPDGKKLRFASSMIREEGYRGHFRQEQFESEFPVGLPIGMKVEELPAFQEGDKPKKVIKSFNAETGKFIGWMKETTQGTSDYSPEQKEALAELEMHVEPPLDLFNETVSPEPNPDGSISNPEDLNVKSEPTQENSPTLVPENVTHENKKFTIPTSNVGSSTPTIEVPEEVYNKWKEVDDKQKNETKRADNLGLNYQEKSGRKREIAMKYAAEKRKILGTLTHKEKKTQEALINKIKKNGKEENPINGAELTTGNNSSVDKERSTDSGGKTKTLRKGTSKGGQKIKNPEILFALRHEVFTPKDLALQYFIGGNKIHPASVRSLWKKSNKEFGLRIGLVNRNSPTIEGIAHHLWESNSELKYDTSDYYNAIEEVLNDFYSRTQMAQDINARYSKVEPHDFSLQEKEMSQALQEIEGTPVETPVENIVDELEKEPDETLITFAKNVAEFREWEGGKDIVKREEDAPFQKKSSRQGDVQKVVDVIQNNFPKVKVVYDPELNAAGRLKGDSIIINPYYAGTDTPIHEAAHILLDAMGENKVVQAAVAQLKDTDLWNETAEKYPELNEKALANEVLAEAIGREGVGIFKTEQEKTKFRQFLDYILDWFKRKLGIEKNIAKSLARQIIAGQGTKDLQGQSTKDQIVGENAKLRAQALDNLGVAKLMESKGLTAKDIKALTSWEKGADGKWKYEINDNGVFFDPKMVAENMLAVQPGKEVNLGKLSEVFNFKDLYDLYPGISDEYSLILTNSADNYEGAFDARRKAILVNTRQFRNRNIRKGVDEKGSPDQNGSGNRVNVADILGETRDLRGLRRLIGHELQHLVQLIEGFQRGSNPSSSNDKKYKDQVIKKLDDQISKLDAKLPTPTSPWTQEHDDIIEQIDKLEKEKLGVKNSDVSYQAYSHAAGEVEARNVGKRYDFTPEERKNSLLEDTEDIARESQILLDINPLLQKFNTKNYNYFRDKFLGRDSEQEQTDLENIKELLKDPELTEEEKNEIKEVRNVIQDQIAEDREEYDKYLVEKKKVEKIQLAEELKEYTLDELVQAYNFAKQDGENFSDAAMRIAVYLNNQGTDRLREKVKDIDEKANSKDLTTIEKWMKVLSNISEYYPPLQELHKVYEKKHLEQTQEANKLKSKHEKLGKAVIKEKNRGLGIVSDLFNSNSAKYFNYLDDGGRLRTNKKGLSKAQSEYLDFISDLVKDRNEILNDDGQAVDNTLIRIDKGFWETFKSDGYKAALTTMLPKESENKLDWKGALTQRFDRPYKGDSYSKDFYKAANIFIEDLTHTKYMKDVVPIVNGIEMFYQKLGQEERKNFKNLLGYIEEWKKNKLYLESGTTQAAIDIPLRLLRGLTSLSVMGFNLPANTWNVIIGNINNIVKDGPANLIKGMGRLATPKGRAILKHYDVVNHDYDSNPKVHVGKLFETMAFAGLRFGEYQIQGSNFLGKIDDKDYEKLKFENDEIKTKDKEELDQKAITYKNEVSDVHGKYSEKDKSNAANYELGKALLQFKQWAPAFWKDKFGPEFVNADNEVKRGTFNYTRAAWQELKDDWNKNGPIVGTWKNKQTMSNLKYLTTLAALAIITHADDDDEDKRKQAMSVDNALQQMLFVFDPQQAKYLVESPVAAIGPVSKLIDATTAIYHGNGKKFKKNAKKLIPFNKLMDIVSGK